MGCSLGGGTEATSRPCGGHLENPKKRKVGRRLEKDNLSGDQNDVEHEGGGNLSKTPKVRRPDPKNGLDSVGDGGRSGGECRPEGRGH